MCVQDLDCFIESGMHAHSVFYSQRIRGPWLVLRHGDGTKTLEWLKINPMGIHQQGFIINRCTGGFQVQAASNGHRDNLIAKGLEDRRKGTDAGLVRAGRDPHKDLASGQKHIAALECGRRPDVFYLPVGGQHGFNTGHLSQAGCSAHACHHRDLVYHHRGVLDEGGVRKGAIYRELDNP